MEQELSVRPYRPGEDADIVELLQIAFNGWPKFDLACSSLDHWRWKYLDNPLNGSVTVALMNGRVVGCDHSTFRRIKFGGKVYLCDYGGDTAVHPDSRGKGVHKKMLEVNRKQRIDAGVHFSYFVTGNPILIKSYSKDSLRKR